MTFAQLEALFLSSLSLLLLAIVFGMLLAWGWAFQRIAKGASPAPSHPLRPLPMAHWGAGTILLATILYLGTSVAVGTTYSALTGGRGADRKADQVAAKTEPGGPKGAEAPIEAKPRDPLETILLTSVASILFCLIAFPVLRWWSDIEPSDLGLFVDRWRLQIRFGVIAAFLATPGTYAIQLAATKIWRVNEHPVQQMMMERFTPTVATLALLLTVFLAPLVEETLFRGILQRWLTRLFGSGQRAVPPPLPASSAPTVNDAAPLFDEPAISEPAAERVDEPLVLDPSDSNADEPGARMAIVTTSILFAALHGAQWPAPIALFVLSLVLGGLYQKTGSLLAAMVMHGVFNGFSTLLLIVQLVGQHMNLKG